MQQRHESLEAVACLLAPASSLLGAQVRVARQPPPDDRGTLVCTPPQTAPYDPPPPGTTPAINQ